LAKLPESSNPSEAFALTRVVAHQDERNVVLVARDVCGASEGGKARLGGFMVLTSEVDVSSLSDVFDLHPYDNFLEQQVYEAQHRQAADSVRTKKVCAVVWGCC
jgi:hypothetical protein